MEVVWGPATTKGSVRLEPHEGASHRTPCNCTVVPVRKWRRGGAAMSLINQDGLLQVIFPTQGLNPGGPYCRWILYQLSHKGSPRIPEWVACPFSSRSFQPRNQTRVFCIAGGFFKKPRGSHLFSNYNGEYRLPLVLAQGSPIIHSSCEGELGIALVQQFPSGERKACSPTPDHPGSLPLKPRKCDQTYQSPPEWVASGAQRTRPESLWTIRCCHLAKLSSIIMTSRAPAEQWTGS